MQRVSSKSVWKILERRLPQTQAADKKFHRTLSPDESEAASKAAGSKTLIKTDRGMGWYKSKVFQNSMDSSGVYHLDPVSHVSLKLLILGASPDNAFSPSPNERVIVKGKNNHILENTDVICGVFNVQQSEVVDSLDLKPVYTEKGGEG